MKTRIITAVFGITLLALVLFFYNSLALNFFVSLLCAAMVYEMFCATKMFKKAFFIFVVSEIYAVVFPFLKLQNFKDFRLIFLIVYIILNVFFLLRKNNEVRVYDVVFCCVFSIFATLFCCNIIYIRFKFSPYGLYYAILFFIIPWICDAGAYFLGLKFGKNKLAPRISPKKTVEGAIGGALSCFLAVFLYNLIFIKFFSNGLKINIANLVVLTAIGVVFSIVGDLFMSVFKRQTKIKDFGDLIKGHGGVLDRFDSWLFVVAVLYPYIKHFPILIF